MSGKRQRDILRIIHLACTIPLGFLVYAPVAEYGFLRPICQFAVVPLLAATGLWMWQQARVRRLLGGTGSAADAHAGRAGERRAQ